VHGRPNQPARPSTYPFPIHQPHPRHSKVVGSTLGASRLLDPEGSARVIGVRSANGEPVLNPHVGTVLHAGDIIIVQGGQSGPRAVWGDCGLRRWVSLAPPGGSRASDWGPSQGPAQWAESFHGLLARSQTCNPRSRHPTAGSAHDNQQFAAHHGLNVLLFEGIDAAGVNRSGLEDGSVTSDEGEATLAQASGFSLLFSAFLLARAVGCARQAPAS
jgi:hypothetical protein